LNNTTLVIFIVACLVGVSTLLLFSGGGIQTSESAIPPTPAIKTITVDTSHWAGFDTVVDTEVYDDQVFYMTDGSIILNVTSSP